MQTQTQSLKIECKTFADYGYILVSRLIRCTEALLEEVNAEVAKSAPLTFNDLRNLILRKLKELMGNRVVEYYFDEAIDWMKVYGDPTMYRVVDAVDELDIELVEGVKARFNVHADYVVVEKDDSDIVIYYKINSVELDVLVVEVLDE